jgi:hypothetical protein
MRIIAFIFSLLAIFAIGCGDDSGSSSSASSSGEVASNSGGSAGNTGGAPSAGGGMGGDMGESGGGMGGMGGDMSEMMGGDMGEGGEGMGMGGPGMGGMDGDMSEMMGGTMGEGGEGMGMGGDMSEMMGGTMGEGGEGMGMGEGMGEMAGMGGMGEGMGGMGEGMGGMGGGQPTPKTLAEMANNSYAQGKDKQAIDLIYAAAIADENPANILTHFRWIPGAKRPGLAVRFGLAVNVKMTPRDYNGDAKPIGTEQKLTSNRGGNNGNQGFGNGSGGPPGLDGMEGMGDMAGMGGMGGPGMGMGGQSGGGIPEELKKYTGDLGEEIAKALKERVTKGHFGTILQIAASKSSPSGGGDSMGMGGMDGMGGGGMGDMAGMGGGGMGGMGGGGGSNGIAPGIVMLGEGTIDQVLETAVEEDLDAVIFFDISIAHIPKNGLVRNTTNMSLYDVSSGRQLKKSVPLVNIALQTERKRAKDQKKPDPLVEKVDDFLKTVDMNYKMAKMPQNLTAAVVQEHRLIPLVNSKTISPLKALAEIAFYYKYDLCPEAHRKIAYDSIVGQQMSAQLIAGNLELRLSAVDVFLDVESSKILLKPAQAENDGSGSPFGNEGALPGAGAGSSPMGTPDAAVGAFPGAM